MTAALQYHPTHGGFPTVTQRRRATLHRIAQDVADRYGVTLENLLSRIRTKAIAGARAQAMREAHALGFGHCEIARAYNRTHGAVSHAINKIR